MDFLRNDLRYAARKLLRAPGFTAIAVLTLTLGIGATTAIFSVVNGIVLRPLAFHEPERLVQLRTGRPERRNTGAPLSSPDFLDYRAQTKSFAAVAAMDNHTVNVTGGTDPEQLRAARVSPNFWQVLGVAPALGRAWDAAEDRPGGARSVVISDGLWRRQFGGDPRAVAAALAPLRGRYAAALHGDGWSIVSATPELFVERRGDLVRTMPIKGTRPADSAERIADSPKDLAEHVMIVDLERNDLSRVCVPGTVHVPVLAAEEPMAGVRHMVSTVEGRMTADHGLADLLRATFPGGSVTGAPKVAAVDHIARLEPVGRGASMGALGTVWPNGDLELGLTIRTFAIAAGRIHLWVGGGIVWDSDPAAEHEEALVKARPLLAHLGAAIA
jgi:hypothetical protein